ncbi:MAG TPA: TolC family protein [Pirellulales bacterium]|nr:TolC family protein [Pirellulales bacterium]
MLSQRLQLPPNLPGAQAPHLRLPAYDPENPGPRSHVIDKIFPDLPPVWPLDMPRPTPERPAMTLKQLQDLANQYNPLLIQARANVTSMEGDAINAGQHPNPIVGYESDTVGSSLSRDYQGIYVSQLVKTANKLNLARSAANVDVMNAQLAVRRTQMEVFARVKTNYFAVLVAQENVIVTGALVRLADEVFEIQRSRLRTAGEAAGFEPGQLRGLADIAKTQLVLAENTYVAAWKALVAHLGLPNMPPMPLVGRADMPVPVVTYQAALARMLSVHPDIMIGRNMVTRAQYALRLEEVTPIPDVVLYFTAQKDFTQPGARSTSYNSQVGLPLPIWNRNQGNIISARGDLGQARQQIRRAEMELTTRLANTFNQYSTNRITVQFYADKILPDYANAYRGVYELHQLAPEQMGFEGIIVAQTQLAQAIAGYIAALNLQWSAVADLSYLMQVETLEEMAAWGGGRETPGPEPIPPPPAGARPNPRGGRP